MATVAIVGASGYAGQESLDRVLGHPGLELYALGSDGLAGQPADALDLRLGRNGWSRIPRFITNEAALSCGADVVLLCLSHEEAAAVEPPARTALSIRPSTGRGTASSTHSRTVSRRGRTGSQR